MARKWCKAVDVEICSGGCAGIWKLVGDFGISPINAQDTGGLLWVHGINQLFMAGKGEDVTIGLRNASKCNKHAVWTINGYLTGKPLGV